MKMKKIYKNEKNSEKIHKNMILLKKEKNWKKLGGGSRYFN